jgi:hypothetical protein
MAQRITFGPPVTCYSAHEQSSISLSQDECHTIHRWSPWIGRIVVMDVLQASFLRQASVREHVDDDRWQGNVHRRGPVRPENDILGDFGR